MIHPSYKEMIEKINDTAVAGDMTITNRYSLVLATAKRARQINAGSEPLVDAQAKEKNLSVAVEEFYAGRIHVLDDEYPEEYEEYYDEDEYPEEYESEYYDDSEYAEEEAGDQAEEVPAEEE
ncbi:MAG: DNA-directed RNA polymerase subunit omega [Lachnospiraceae bacterium]|nr:DNA-directed RNA polymerase subunit omega [Lachnospiraceae bacterium]